MMDSGMLSWRSTVDEVRDRKHGEKKLFQSNSKELKHIRTGLYFIFPVNGHKHGQFQTKQIQQVHSVLSSSMRSMIFRIFKLWAMLLHAPCVQIIWWANKNPETSWLPDYLLRDPAQKVLFRSVQQDINWVCHQKLATNLSNQVTLKFAPKLAGGCEMGILPYRYKFNHMDIWFAILTILKNMKVNGKDYPIYDGK